MDLLLQVSEKELEEFPEPPVDHTDQDKPDRTSTGGTQSSNISHQLQTQTQTSTASKASKVSTASVSQQPRYGRPAMWPATQLAMWPVPCTPSYIGRSNTTSHLPIFLHCWCYRWNPTWRCFSRTLSAEALRYLHLGIHMGKSHPYL